MAGITFLNGLRLHFDSIALFKRKSYPSARALSILALEEFGKFEVLDWVVFNIGSNGMRMDAELWKTVNESILSHKAKQNFFANRAHYPWMRQKNGKPGRPTRFWRLCDSGELDRLKQKSFYVGFGRRKNLKAPRTHIVHPFYIGEPAAKRVITIVNDFLLALVIDVVCEFSSVDSEWVDLQLSGSLGAKLVKSWRHRGREGHEAIRHLKKSLLLHTTEEHPHEREKICRALVAMGIKAWALPWSNHSLDRPAAR